MIMKIIVVLIPPIKKSAQDDGCDVLNALVFDNCHHYHNQKSDFLYLEDDSGETIAEFNWKNISGFYVER